MEQGNRGVEAGESTHPQGRCIQDALGVCSAFERRSNSDTVLLWLRAQGHGGQILLSESTRAHLHERVPPDARLRRLGAFTLKALAGPGADLASGGAGLARDVPRPKAAYGQMTYNHDIANAIPRCHMSQTQEPVTISIRAKAGQRDLIDQAADRLGRSRSDFMLEAACRQAEDVLLDQTFFTLDAKGFAAFQKMLDRPPAPTDRLRRTLEARAPWDTTSVPTKAAGQRAK